MNNFILRSIRSITFSLFFYMFNLFAVEEIDLSLSEYKIFSQNGEDGVITSIFSQIGTTNKYFVEFGVQDGAECNTRNLRENYGWAGLMMDNLYENLSINLSQEFITAENINDLFSKYSVPSDFDLLSIDIDYNDFYVWHAIKKHNPRVVIIEYNATHLPNEDKIAVYYPTGMWDDTNYFGAGILSLKKLGEKKGYTLVYADNNGVNLFFIRSDILTKLKNEVKYINQGDVEKIYKRPRYGTGPNGGHKQDPLQRTYFDYDEAVEYMYRFNSTKSH